MLSRFVAFMTDLTLLTIGCRQQANELNHLPAVASSDQPVPYANRMRAGRFHRRKPGCESDQHVASFRPRSLGTETVDICGGALAWAPRARRVHRAGAIVPPRMSC